jgi:hypothetical protein
LGSAGAAIGVRRGDGLALRNRKTIQNRHLSPQVEQNVSWSVLSVQERIRSLFRSAGPAKMLGRDAGRCPSSGRAHAREDCQVMLRFSLSGPTPTSWGRWREYHRDSEELQADLELGVICCLRCEGDFFLSVQHLFTFSRFDGPLDLVSPILTAKGRSATRRVQII